MEEVAVLVPNAKMLRYPRRQSVLPDVKNPSVAEGLGEVHDVVRPAPTALATLTLWNSTPYACRATPFRRVSSSCWWRTTTKPYYRRLR